MQCGTLTLRTAATSLLLLSAARTSNLSLSHVGECSVSSLARGKSRALQWRRSERCLFLLPRYFYYYSHNSIPIWVVGTPSTTLLSFRLLNDISVPVNDLKLEVPPDFEVMHLVLVLLAIVHHHHQGSSICHDS